MSEVVRVERQGEIGIVCIDNPPVNALSRAVREGLLAAVEALESDSSIRALVLHGVGRNFLAGADLRELEEGPTPPLLKDVLARLEASAKPVIAVLHGATLGGGAEAALASHYRCASRDVQLGFPEVKLGLVPGAGGTVRLPRLVGVKSALELIMGGEPIDVERARELRLIDRVLEGDLRTAAVDYARELLASGAEIRRLRDCAIPDGVAAAATVLREARARIPRAVRKLAAVEAVLQCMEAAVADPFDVALARARELFETCRTSNESRALRYLFRAERARAAIRELPRQIEAIAIVGAGTMGAGIAASCALSGLPVILTDSSPLALEAGVARLGSVIDSGVKKGRLTTQDGAAAKMRVRATAELSDIREADLVIEAVYEDLAIKQQLFADLGKLCKRGAVLATNTSSIDVEAIASASGRAADVVGMHFFSPAHLMRLVEIVRTCESSPEVLATALAVAKRLGKIGVIVGNAFGFVGNRMLYAYGREKELLMLEGATPQAIDRALEDFGMAMGPNAVADLAGLDVGARVRSAWKERPDDRRFYRISDLLVEQGRFGRKSGRGFYRYHGSSNRRESDPEVLELIAAEARVLGIPRRIIPDREIVERCLIALINEGAHILDEGVARSAADIDVIWCNGYGFPRNRGGPMYYADSLGLGQVLSLIERYAREHGARYWSAAPRIVRLAAAGKRLTETP